MYISGPRPLRCIAEKKHRALVGWMDGEGLVNDLNTQRGKRFALHGKANEKERARRKWMRPEWKREMRFLWPSRRHEQTAYMLVNRGTVAFQRRCYERKGKEGRSNDAMNRNAELYIVQCASLTSTLKLASRIPLPLALAL